MAQMARKWFQLVGEDGNALTSADAVVVDIEDVVALRHAVKGACPNALANVDAADLTVFAVTQEGKKALEEDSPIGSYGATKKDALIVQVHQRAVAQSRFGVASSLWLVNGSVENALVTKGVRSRVYRLADSNLGFYVRKQDAAMDENAIWYEGKTLRIHVGFEAKEHALYFRSQIHSEPLAVGSPLRGAVVTTSVAQTTGVATELRQILFSDYNPTDSESPQETNSSIAPSVSMCGPTDDLFKYQRIEDASLFGSVGRAENAHLMSHAHCVRYSTSYGNYDKDENNRLALSPDVHTFYDASVPAINIKAISSAPFEQGAENRYKVEIEVSVLDHSYKHLLNRLKEGSTHTEDPLVMRTFVEVKNPIIFCKCLEWKFKQNQAAWQEYFAMDSAVE